MDNQALDIDGNAMDVTDQGEVLDASHSQADTAVTESKTPGTPENAAAQEQAKTVAEKNWEQEYKSRDKEYTSLQKEFTRRSQELAELRKAQQQYEPYKDKLQSWQQADEVLSKDPVAFKYVQARIQGYSHEAAQNYAEQSVQPQNKHLAEMAERLQKTEEYVKSMQHASETQKAAAHLDAQERAANEVYKNFFGKEMTENEKASLYNYMAENRFFNGEAAAKALFAEQFAEARAQKLLEEQKAKGSMLVQRTPIQNSVSAKTPAKTLSFRDAFNESMKELRGE